MASFNTITIKSNDGSIKDRSHPWVEFKVTSQPTSCTTPYSFFIVELLLSLNKVLFHFFCFFPFHMFIPFFSFVKKISYFHLFFVFSWRLVFGFLFRACMVSLWVQMLAEISDPGSKCLLLLSIWFFFFCASRARSFKIKKKVRHFLEQCHRVINISCTNFICWQCLIRI